MSPAEHEIDVHLQSAPFDVEWLVRKADARERAGDVRSATAFYQAALRAASRQDRLPSGWIPHLDRAQRSLREAAAAFIAYLDGALEAAGFPRARRPPRFQESVEILTGQRQARIELQRPGAYYYPGLPQRRYYERSEFPWATSIEALASLMREELAAWTAGGGDGFRPYMASDPSRPRLDVHSLVDNPQWSTLHLFENGAAVQPQVAHFPRSFAAIDGLDLPRITTRAPSILFSRLAPGAHIPPHTGVMNARLICHLPLVVPSGCGFRVGGEARAWREGELLVFDDTVEHEAWNRGTRDRVIVIFDIWRPELDATERAAVQALFEAVDAYGLI